MPSRLKPPHVLVVSTIVDLATDAVVRKLSEMGVRITRWNTERFPFFDRVTVAFAEKSVRSEIWSSFDQHPTHLDDVTSVWYRRLRTPEEPEGMDEGVHDFCVREGRAAVLGVLLGGLSSNVRWTSHPSHVWLAENKLYQLRTARQVGFTIPETLVTNSGQHVRSAHLRFANGMIAKPTRTGYVEIEGEPFAIYTSTVEDRDLADLPEVDRSPVIYQPLIPKAADIRVTVVGDQVFAAQIHSQDDPAARVDWRHTADPDLPHSPFELAPSDTDLVRRFMSQLQLRFGALDFVLTPDGDLVFLEINPNGQWLWLDEKLDLGITEALAAHLAFGD